VKVETLRRFTPTDYPEAPDWFHRFANLLNNTLEQLTQLTQKNIGTDNINEEVREITIVDDQEFDLSLQVVKGKPIAAWVVFVTGMRRHNPLEWEPRGGSQLRCKLKFLAAPGKPVLIRIMVRGS